MIKHVTTEQSMRSMLVMSLIGLIVAFFVQGTTVAGVNAKTKQEAKLTIAPSKVTVKSGYHAKFRVSIRNLKTDSLTFGELFGWKALGVTPADPEEMEIEKNQLGQIYGNEPNHGSRIRVTIPPRESWDFSGGNEVTLLPDYDLTVPGTYQMRFTFKGIPGTISNPISITVEPPYKHIPENAIVVAEATKNLFPADSSDKIQMSCVEVPADGMSPILFNVYIFSGKATAETIRLTGNPLVDFQKFQVKGPDDLEFVRQPKPHYIRTPNHQKPVHLTAYGKQLASQKASNSAEWKTYTLKSGKIYKYTIPINLGCQFDMSLPGTYHVRLQLAHGKVQSDWTDIQVPYGAPVPEMKSEAKKKE